MVKSITWREFQSLSYKYFEQEKDGICEVYGTERYNPSVITRKFIAWRKKEGLSPLVDKQTPLGIHTYLAQMSDDEKINLR